MSKKVFSPNRNCLTRLRPRHRLQGMETGKSQVGRTLGKYAGPYVPYFVVPFAVAALYQAVVVEAVGFRHPFNLWMWIAIISAAPFVAAFRDKQGARDSRVMAIVAMAGVVCALWLVSAVLGYGGADRLASSSLG